MTGKRLLKGKWLKPQVKIVSTAKPYAIEEVADWQNEQGMDLFPALNTMLATEMVEMAASDYIDAVSDNAPDVYLTAKETGEILASNAKKIEWRLDEEEKLVEILNTISDSIESQKGHCKS